MRLQRFDFGMWKFKIMWIIKSFRRNDILQYSLRLGKMTPVTSLGDPSLSWGSMEVHSHFLWDGSLCMGNTDDRRSSRGLLCPMFWQCSLHMHRKCLSGNKEKANRIKTEIWNLFHQVVRLAADLRLLSFSESMRCNLFPVMLNKIANSCGNIWYRGYNTGR